MDDESSEFEPPPQRPRRLGVSVLLFLGACVSTYLTGAVLYSPRGGLVYSAAIMITLLAHELGHFFQAMRYGVPASYPYFIPVPGTPIGTMGAVIFMQPGVGDRRALFDIGITGPLAGLVPALLFSIVGLQLSTVVDVTGHHTGELGEPLIFKAFSYWIFGPLGEHQEVALHPLG